MHSYLAIYIILQLFFYVVNKLYEIELKKCRFYYIIVLVEISYELEKGKLVEKQGRKAADLR